MNIEKLKEFVFLAIGATHRQEPQKFTFNKF